MRNDRTISCIIPAWNEAARIGAVLAVAAHHPDLDEVIVVDDGSSDGTADLAEALALRAPKLRVLRMARNGGKTAAVAAGIAAARGDWLMFLDADLEGLAPRALSRLAEPVLAGRADAAVSLRSNAPLAWRMIGLDYISGERVVARGIFDAQALAALPRFGLEVHMNRLLIEHSARIAVVAWPGVRSPLKAEKHGLWRGIISDFGMMRDIFKVLTPWRAAAQIVALRRQTAAG